MNDTTRQRLRSFFALLSGALFGLGLAVSGMVYPAKVLAFLDVTGAWDPTLAFVMFGALAVTTPAFRYILKRRQPWFEAAFALPTRTDIEPRLVLGAALFGIGWGIAGLCPGPAVTALVSGQVDVYAFVLSMLGGFLLHDWLDAARARSRKAGVRIEHGRPR